MNRPSQSKYKRLIKNLLLLVTGNFVSKVVSFLMVPFYTSILTTSDYGIADLISTTVLLVLPFFSLLMDEAVMRFTLEENCSNKQVFTIAFVISTAGFLAVMCISPVILLFDNLKSYYWFIVLYYVVSWIYNLVVNYVRGLDKLSITTTVGIIHTFVYLLLNIIFLAIFKIGVYGYLFAINLSNLVSILFLVVTCKLYKNFIPFKEIDWNLAKKMVKYSLPMIPNYISWWVNNSSDRYMVSYFCGTSVTGIYSVAYKIPTLLSSMTSIFSSAWKISSVEDFGSEESVHFYNRVYKTYSGFLLMGAAGLILFTQFLAKILFAKEFYNSWKITPILIIAYVFSALAQYIESIFNAAKQTKTLFYGSLIGAITNIIMNAILIPKFAGTGAAIATVISYIIIWSIDMINSRKLLIIKFNLFKIISALFIMIIEIFAILHGDVVGYLIATICFISIAVLNGSEFCYIVKIILKKVKSK